MANVPVSNMTVTWTDSGTTYNAVKMNVTDTASNAASLLMDLQVGTVSKFKVPKNGNPVFVVPTSGYLEVNGNGDGFRAANGSTISAYGIYGVRMGASNTLSWGSSADGPATADTTLARDAANTLAQRNATNAQIFRVYGTYTDASNYERAFLKTQAGNLQFGFEKAGTGTNRILELVGGNGIAFNALSSGIVWQINTSGHFTAGTDNTYDIGASGANRPRNIYAGTSLVLATASFVANGSFPYLTTTTGNVTQFNAAGGLNIAGNGSFGFTANATSALTTADTIIVRDAANTLALRNATSPQMLNAYSTYTDASNYARLSFDINTGAGGQAIISAEGLGTGANTLNLTLRASGTNRQIIINQNGSDRWRFDGNSHFIAAADNTYDIGASGANRPRIGYFGTRVDAPTIRTDTAYTVATLPAAGTAGRRAYVTDATAPTWLGALTGGGAVRCPVFDNGTAWVAG